MGDFMMAYFFKLSDIAGVNEPLCICCSYVTTKFYVLILECLLNFDPSFFDLVTAREKRLKAKSYMHR